jgi:hypothetical protein
MNDTIDEEFVYNVHRTEADAAPVVLTRCGRNRRLSHLLLTFWISDETPVGVPYLSNHHQPTQVVSVAWRRGLVYVESADATPPKKQVL